LKTKKSDEFVKHALKRTKTKFAVVGSGTTWTFYEGSDLAKATASKGETMIKATAQKAQTALKMLVVGGTPEVTTFKTRVFAAQLKADPKSVTFKNLPAEDDALLEQLQLELDGPLVEQVGSLPMQAREAALPLLNQAKALAEDGDYAGAKAKVLELKKQLGGQQAAKPHDNDDEAAQRKKLAGELQGALVEQVARLKSPQRDPLLKLLNEAMKLAKDGDLGLARQRTDDLKQALGQLPPSRPSAPTPVVPTPVAFKAQLSKSGAQFQAVLKLAPPNKGTLDTLMKQIVEAGNASRFDEGFAKLQVLEAEMKLSLAFVQLKAEKNPEKKMRLCEAFLETYKDHPNEVAQAEDIYAEARKEWGVNEAKKAYGAQMKGISDPKLNPGNKFAPKNMKQSEKGDILAPAIVKDLSKRLGISEEEVIAIRTYTAADYAYINPAVANQEDHPERQKQGSDGNKVTWMDAQHKPDPGKAKNPTERRQLEQDLKEYEEKKKRSLREEGGLHAGMIMEAFKKLPRKSGPLYRGARMNMARFHNDYQVGKKIPIEAFISQSVSPDVARSFAAGGGNVKLPDDSTVSVFVEVQVHDARDVSEISIYGAGEAEWLLPPGGFLEVKSIEDDTTRNAGTPTATAWKKVKMEQVFK
jgi:hypothetical protein